MEVFGWPFQRSFTEDTVKAAFSATGMHSFNPEAISKKQTKLSLLTSTKGSFPLPQSSPVHAVISAMGAQPPTAFDLALTTHLGPIAGPSQPRHSSPPTPTLRWHDHNPNIDPDLDKMPSK